MERKNGEETEGKAATLLLPFLKIFIFPLQSPEERSAAEGAGKAGDRRAGNTPPGWWAEGRWTGIRNARGGQTSAAASSEGLHQRRTAQRPN